MAERRKEVWHCPRCGTQITTHVRLSQPPAHPCGGSSRVGRFTELVLLISTTATDSVGSDTYADTHR